MTDITLQFSTHVHLIRIVLEAERKRRCWAFRNIPHRMQKMVSEVNVALDSLKVIETNCDDIALPAFSKKKDSIYSAIEMEAAHV